METWFSDGAKGTHFLKEETGSESWNHLLKFIQQDSILGAKWFWNNTTQCVWGGTLVKNAPSWAYTKPIESELLQEGLGICIYNKLPTMHKKVCEPLS